MSRLSQISCLKKLNFDVPLSARKKIDSRIEKQKFYRIMDAVQLPSGGVLIDIIRVKPGNPPLLIKLQPPFGGEFWEDIEYLVNKTRVVLMVYDDAYMFTVL
jgi:hypothetical protein